MLLAIFVADLSWFRLLKCYFVYIFGVSTYGNPLVTSSFIGENLFAIGLTLLSIGLFAQLIGNMQVICLVKHFQ